MSTDVMKNLKRARVEDVHQEEQKDPFIQVEPSLPGLPADDEVDPEMVEEPANGQLEGESDKDYSYVCKAADDMKLSDAQARAFLDGLLRVNGLEYEAFFNHSAVYNIGGTEVSVSQIDGAELTESEVETVSAGGTSGDPELTGVYIDRWSSTVQMSHNFEYNEGKEEEAEWQLALMQATLDKAKIVQADLAKINRRALFGDKAISDFQALVHLMPGEDVNEVRMFVGKKPALTRPTARELENLPIWLRAAKTDTSSTGAVFHPLPYEKGKLLDDGTVELPQYFVTPRVGHKYSSVATCRKGTQKLVDKIIPGTNCSTSQDGRHACHLLRRQDVPIAISRLTDDDEEWELAKRSMLKKPPEGEKGRKLMLFVPFQHAQYYLLKGSPLIFSGGANFFVMPKRDILVLIGRYNPGEPMIPRTTVQYLRVAGPKKGLMVREAEQLNGCEGLTYRDNKARMNFRMFYSRFKKPVLKTLFKKREIGTTPQTPVHRYNDDEGIQFGQQVQMDEESDDEG